MQLARAVRRPHLTQSDLCTTFCSLYIAARGLSSTAARHSEGSSNNATPNPMHSAPPQSTKRDAVARSFLARDDQNKIPKELKLTPAERAALAQKKAREAIAAERKKVANTQIQGGLADNSIFADDMLPEPTTTTTDPEGESVKEEDRSLAKRSPANMALRLNPKPNARARWQRMMVIRQVRRRGRLTKEMRIARTERSHLSKSAFFKTSVKKLMPLARQIAGKHIDEAILQMRFSKKKAAIEVRQHLVQARDEAIVMRGMGINPTSGTIDAPKDTESAVVEDSGITPPLAHQTPTKSQRDSVEKSPTEIYVAQAWVNRGPYGKLAMPRARGRLDIQRPPHTGISVILKEEQTRTREKMEKQAKEIRRRMGKNMWTQLPDRPITRQGQYVLW